MNSRSAQNEIPPVEMRGHRLQDRVAQRTMLGGQIEKGDLVPLVHSFRSFAEPGRG